MNYSDFIEGWYQPPTELSTQSETTLENNQTTEQNEVVHNNTDTDLSVANWIDNTSGYPAVSWFFGVRATD